MGALRGTTDISDRAGDLRRTAVVSAEKAHADEERHGAKDRAAAATE